jgi:hypothetical protein
MPTRRVRWLGIIAIALAANAYSGIHVWRGYRFAREAAANGVSVDARLSLDRWGVSAGPSQAALRKDVEFNATAYEEIARADAGRRWWRADLGVSQFCFAVGVKIGRVP